VRRILGDDRLDPATCYEPALARILDWESVLATTRQVVLIVDESTDTDVIHLLRISLAYRGGSLPLVWAAWEQNVAQPEGFYWQTMDTLLERVAVMLPAGVTVIVTADRAYDIPAFLDRMTARDWHWVVRLKTKASTRFLDTQGIEQPVAALLQRRLKQPRWRCKCRGKLFKEAGWREVSLVGIWAEREDEALVVITDLPPTYQVLRHYGRRFWTEPGFRTDKRAGWQWESCQVRSLAHHQVLLLAMAWATLITLCLGAEVAQQQLTEQATHRPRRPQPARYSLFRLGLKVVRAFLHHPDQWHLRWCLPALDAPSWNHQWLTLQRRQVLGQTVLP
jgi:hypothetical protein